MSTSRQLLNDKENAILAEISKESSISGSRKLSTESLHPSTTRSLSRDPATIQQVTNVALFPKMYLHLMTLQPPLEVGKHYNTALTLNK